MLVSTKILLFAVGLVFIVLVVVYSHISILIHFIITTMILFVCTITFCELIVLDLVSSSPARVTSFDSFLAIKNNEKEQ